MEQPQFNALSPAMKKRLDQWQAEHEGEPLGDIATKLLFENELVRVWEMHLAPGERSDRHRHELPYVMCIVAGSQIDAEIEEFVSQYEVFSWCGHAPPPRT